MSCGEEGEEEGEGEQQAVGAGAQPTCMRCALECLPAGPCW
jgi:hypothetical protein